MKIKFNTSIGSVDFNYAAKQVAEVDDDLAAKWIESGTASAVEDQAPLPAVEHAAVQVPETPESPKRRK